MSDPDREALSAWDRLELEEEDDSDCEAALDQAIRKKGGDPERYEDKQLEADIEKYSRSQGAPWRSK